MHVRTLLLRSRDCLTMMILYDTTMLRCHDAEHRPDTTPRGHEHHSRTIPGLKLMAPGSGQGSMRLFGNESLGRGCEQQHMEIAQGLSRPTKAQDSEFGQNFVGGALSRGRVLLCPRLL